MDIILLMRLSYYKYYDQINTIKELGINIHLISEVILEKDANLFQSISILPDSATKSEILNTATKLKKQFPVQAVLTFLEPDIILAAEISAHLGIPGLDKTAAIISRDKNKQREFLSQANIPSPQFIAIKNKSDVTENSINQLKFPLIVKPTQASLSAGVRLCNNFIQVIESIDEVISLAQNDKMNFYEENSTAIALIEEFLPGEEVTLDGVVINGRFILGGIHNKRRNMGPTFEEDLYSLPFKSPDHEEQLVNIASNICTNLNLKNAMFNAELRQDSNGNFKVVEFSTRFSAGFCYRHIKMVYQIDLVALYCKSLLNIPISDTEITRQKPTLTSCTKWVFGTGKILKNGAGKAVESAYYEDYAILAKPETIVGPPHGLNCVGRLSLLAPYKNLQSIYQLEKDSFNVAKSLDIVINPLASDYS